MSDDPPCEAVMSEPIWRYHLLDTGKDETIYVIYRRNVKCAYTGDRTHAIMMVNGLNVGESDEVSVS